ncbi:MFS transporter [Myroides sp. LJL116]
MEKIALGLKRNWKQFTLLIVVNIMIGGMVGLERTVVPLVATESFHIQSDVIIFSFIIAFGLVKAVTNLFSGALADRYTRKRVLILGWLVGLPVPFLLAYGPSWNWIIFSNILLGISQGLAWSMTVNMKIDLVGSKNRGLAMGLNEAAGYGAVGLTALLTGYIASSYGLRPAPFYLGIFYTIAGTALSIFLIKDTKAYAVLESKNQGVSSNEAEEKPNLWWVFKQTSYKNKNLFSISQAGLINNLNDGMSWGVFPLLFLSMGVGLEGVGWIKAIYPIVWGVGQIITGPISDRWGRKPLIVTGMFVQVVGHIIIGIEILEPLHAGLWGSVFLGLGTAMVYPALLAGIGDNALPNWRASSLGVYRFYRDMGYAVGALMAGVVGGLFGLMWAVHIAGLLTLISGIIVWVTMDSDKQQS